MGERTLDIDELLATNDSLNGKPFDAIYRHYRPALIRYAIRERATDPEGVADLSLFDAYRAFEKMHYRREASFRSYLYRSVRNYVIDERRRLKAYPEQIAEDPHTLETRHSISTGFEDEFVATAEFGGLIEELPPDQQAVIRCRFFEGLTGPATATKLDKDPNAVYQLQHRAVIRLRQAILAAAVVAMLVVALWATARLNESRLAIDSSPATPTGDTTSGVSQPVQDRVNADIGDVGDEDAAVTAQLADPPDSAVVTSSSVADQGATTTTGGGSAITNDRELTTTLPHAAPTSSPAGPPVPASQTTAGPPIPTTPPVTTGVQSTPVTTDTQSTSVTTTTAAQTTSVATTAGPQQPTCNGLIATIVGTPGDDELRGTDGPDVIYGGDGKDDIYGRGGDDTICGGNGKDKIWGQKGNDYLIGGTSNEEDKLFGGQGDDTLVGGSNSDELNPGTGNDTVIPYRP